MRHADRLLWPSTTKRLVRTVVFWLIALALPFDGAAIGAQAARGSLHVHIASTPEALRLVDFRRTDAVAAVTHRHVAAQRHRHAFGDASVVAVGAEEGDADGILAATALSAALGGLPTAAADWCVPQGSGEAPVIASWVPSCGRSARWERPPRAELG